MSAAELNRRASERYGVGIMGLSPTAALWLAEHIKTETGRNVFRAIARLRNKYGAGTAYPEFRSICWGD